MSHFFQVKDQTDYEFNPANLVLSICKIYINLSKSEAFTLAVSQDGRSYSPELFKLAEKVLGKSIKSSTQKSNTYVKVKKNHN